MGDGPHRRCFWCPMALALCLALVAGFVGAVSGMVLYDREHCAFCPLIGFIHLGSAAFLLTFVITLGIALFRGVPWRNDEGKSLPSRLSEGEGPVDVAFWGPIPFLLGLLIVSWLGKGVVHYLYYPAFLGMMGLLQAGVLVIWMYLTWVNASRLQARWREVGLKAASVAFSILLVIQWGLQF